MTTSTDFSPERDGIIGTDASGHPTVRFERRLAHTVERVWEVITDLDHNVAWANGGVAIEPRVGGSVTIRYGQGEDGAPSPTTATVTAWEPPHLLEWDEGDHVIRWELTAAGDLCLLVFVDTMVGEERARNSIICGWHHLIERVEEALEGRPTDFHTLSRDRIVDLYWHYRTKPRPTIISGYQKSSITPHVTHTRAH